MDKRNTLRPDLSRLGELFYFATKVSILKMALLGIKFDIIRMTLFIKQEVIDQFESKNYFCERCISIYVYIN